MSTLITREMGLTHAEFFRTLPNALEGLDFNVQDATVNVFGTNRQLTICLSPEGQRKLAALRVPVTRVTFDFQGYSDAERQAFLQNFERRFQRGGG